MKRQRSALYLAFTIVSLLAAGCAAMPAAPSQQIVSAPPTVNPIFLPHATGSALSGHPLAAAGVPDILVAPAATAPAIAEPTSEAPLTASAAIPEARPTVEGVHASPADATPAATSRPETLGRDVAIYDDTLNPDWSTEHSAGMDYSLVDASHAYSGTFGAAITPQQDYASFFFTVRQGAKETYGVDRVLGVSLWINSGSEALDPSNLAVTVVGSNDYPYWVPDDKSVTIDDKHYFSETRLYYLGINGPVPPNTWVEVDVWLDKLPYEPDFKYVTGIYIKNDQGFRRTFYVDQVHLMMTN